MKGAFARRHPAVNILFFTLAALPAVLCSHPAVLVISTLAAAAYSVKLCGGIKRAAAMLVLPAVLTSLINGAFNHYGVTTLYIFSNGNRLTLEALVYGAAAGTAIAAMLLWFTCWNEVVTEDKFMCIFGKIAPHTALLVLMVLRFVPLYAERLGETARTLSAGEEKGRLHKVRTACKAASGVLTWALEKSIETADSMRARGYGGGKRKSYSRFRFTVRDGVLMTLILLCMAAFIVGMTASGLSASYNPIISVAVPTLAGTAALTAYGILCFMPLFYDAVQEIKWNKSFSKI